MEKLSINSFDIKFLLKNTLASEINNRQVYMRGIHRSHEYEGYYIK